MKAGQVVHIRVSPKDCMRAIDLVKKAGVLTEGMSFAQVISLAFSSMMQAAEQQNLIPSRDGFEFEEMMRPWRGSKNDARKSAITETIYRTADQLVVPTLKPQLTPVNDPVVRARKQVRMRELSFKKHQDPLNFSQEENAELEALVDELVVNS